MACLFGHKWNGCKCTKCGTTRDDGHNWNGCKCEICGKTRSEGHVQANGKCKVCSEKLFSLSPLTLEEMGLIVNVMVMVKSSSNPPAEKDVVARADALVKIFLAAKETGDGWLSETDIFFIRHNTAMYAAWLDNSGDRIRAIGFNKLRQKLQTIAPLV